MLKNNGKLKQVMTLHEGSRARFTYKETVFEGLIVQIQDGEATIKLDTGYNLRIPANDVTNIEPLPTKVKPDVKSSSPEKNPDLPNIVILHTGGTIASKVDYSTGAVVAKFNPEELVALFPDLCTFANIESRLLRNMQSENMRFAHYNLMANAVIAEIKNNVRGIIITHGTDTLHYTTAALSFALENLSIPVLLVGSQRSSDRGSTDAGKNLRGAVRFITEAGVPGVFSALHETSSDDSIAIIDGLHARKNHTSSRDAFRSVNASIVARVVNDQVEIVDQQRVNKLKANATNGETRVLPFREPLRVGWWKTHPQSFVEELEPFEHCEGLLIEGTGLGHGPIMDIDEFTHEQHPRIREKIQELSKRMPVAMSSQTIWGRINLNVYSPLRDLKEMGVLGDGCDMQPETAFIKLAWLLSNYPPQKVRELYGQNLRGEISDRSVLPTTQEQE